MSIIPLQAISPLDGRYSERTIDLRNYFSEFALIKYRTRIEIDYFISLLKELNYDLPEDKKHLLLELKEHFNLEDAVTIKKIEEKNNHDVKAIECFLKQYFQTHEIPYSHFIHFGLTSQDINSVVTTLSIRDFLIDYWNPLMKNLQYKLFDFSRSNWNIPMLSRTHGQPASPTKLGKEILSYYYRMYLIHQQVLQNPKWHAKCGGAVGNLNAHYQTFPDIHWDNFFDTFLSSQYNLYRSKWTTQVDTHPDLPGRLKEIVLLNQILMNLCQDVWMYISYEYFTLKPNQGQVGSSTMPHKVNPIEFENAEGNLELSNEVLNLIIRKMNINRLQRDLTESTVLRNLGVAFGHSVLAYKSIIKGFEKLLTNMEKLQEDLLSHWEVLTEAIQTILRTEGNDDAYEMMRTRIQGTRLDKNQYQQLINSLPINDILKKRLLNMSPMTYTGLNRNNRFPFDEPLEIIIPSFT